MMNALILVYTVNGFMLAFIMGIIASKLLNGV